MKRWNLSAKLVAGGLLSLAVPMIVIGIVSIYNSTQSISKMARKDMAGIAESLVGALGIGMNEQLMMARKISFSNSVIAAAEKVAKEGEKNSRREIALAQKELSKIKDIEGNRLSSILLAGKNGITFASSDSGKMKGLNISDRTYFEKALKGIPNVGSVVVSKAHGRVICTAASPIYASSGKMVAGAVVIAMELKYLTDIIDKIKIGKTGFAYLVDRNGLFITHPIKESILKMNIAQVQGMETVAGLIGQDKSGITEYVRDGDLKVAAVVREPQTDWSVVVAISAVELYAPARLTRNMIIGIGIFFLLLSAVFFFLFARKLTLPLNNIAAAAQRIAVGNLTVDIAPESRADEIGRLANAFSFMTKSLKDKTLAAEKIAAGDLTVQITSLSGDDVLGNAFSAMVEKLRHQIRGISESIAILSSSATEILAATTQVAAGTAETATAISETTTTVEEVRQAAQLSSEKAQHVSSSAKTVAQASQIGRKSVEETIAGMAHIRDQMNSIARTVVRLSEQSQAIGGIIASVTDLADQSNLLAVNAAIEAARAGEQGKGFAVVAQEIRNLSEQSKQATAQIRDILGDIQKATGAAVMATEQGSKAVEAGMKQSEQAGEAILALAKSIDEAVQAAVQIVASSQEQVVGMDQIRIAMQNINQAGMETAASMKQSETAAQNLHHLGQKLKQVVEQYKV